MERDERSGLSPIPQERRQSAIDALVQHYAADHITVDEFERRVDVAHRTHDPLELSRLTVDLPAIRTQPEAPMPEADRLIRRGAQVLAGAVRESQTLVAIMGAFEHRDQHMDRLPESDEESPRLHVRGFVMMGGVEVSVRLPGETAKDASRRIKAERKRRRLEGGS